MLKVTPSGLGEPSDVLGIDPSWSHARQAPYRLCYHSGPKPETITTELELYESPLKCFNVLDFY